MRTALRPSRPTTLRTLQIPAIPKERWSRRCSQRRATSSSRQNYAGYDASSLSYHPFLNGAQQSKDMIDALSAARTALPQTLSAATTDSGKLFITGYSEGGYVAMATHKALQAANQTVTASAPMVWTYALAAFFDAVFYGDVNLGSTEFTPLITTSYQKAYGNIYRRPPTFTSRLTQPASTTLLPSTTPIDTLFEDGKAAGNRALQQARLPSPVTPRSMRRSPCLRIQSLHSASAHRTSSRMTTG